MHLKEYRSPSQAVSWPRGNGMLSVGSGELDRGNCHWVPSLWWRSFSVIDRSPPPLRSVTAIVFDKNPSCKAEHGVLI